MVNHMNTIQFNDLINKYDTFCRIQNSKIYFVKEMIELFKDKLKNKPSLRQQDYLDNIYGDIFLIQEVTDICLKEIIGILEKNTNIGCTTYTKLVELKISLSFLANIECQYCLNLIENCLY